MGGACFCPQCVVLDKRRQAMWQTPSPYLEDLTKSLVISQPARRKLQLVPPRRYPAAISPYETLREASRVSARAQLRAQLQVCHGPHPPLPRFCFLSSACRVFGGEREGVRARRGRDDCKRPSQPSSSSSPRRGFSKALACLRPAHIHSLAALFFFCSFPSQFPNSQTSLPPLPVQTELAERHLQRLWDREASAAAERCGVDLMTYTTLLELQHRDITPEDYDILQTLDSNTKRKTLSQIALDREFPAWIVPESGAVPPNGGAAAQAAAAQAAAASSHARRSLLGDLDSADDPSAESAEGAAEASGGHASAHHDAEGGGLVGGAAEEEEAAAAPPSAASSSADGVCMERRAPAGDDADQRVCSICLEPFTCGQFARSLPCSHSFHRDCIDSWLTQSSRACPEDGLPVFPDPAEEEENAGDGGLPLDEDEQQEQAGYDAASMEARMAGLMQMAAPDGYAPDGYYAEGYYHEAHQG